jgi:hypothetical protein
MRSIIPPGAEHVATQDPGAHVSLLAGGYVVVDARLAAFAALESAGADDPVVQGLAADPERILAGLTRAGAVSVEREREPGYEQA